MKKYTFALIAGILVLFASLGLGRFVFGMILPNMQLDLDMSITQSGFVGTSNFIGYLAGLLIAGAFYSKFGASILIKRALLTQGFCMLLMSISSSYLLVSLFYFFSGFFSALANMAIMAYITQIVPRQIRGKAVGILTVGNGMAIVFSGYLVPYMQLFYDASSWKVSWGIFAVLTMLIAFGVSAGLKHENPHHKQEHKAKESYFAILKDKRFIQIGGLYFCFGVTYVVYVTFFVLASMDKWHITSNLSASFWILLGFLSMLSGPLFGIISDIFGRLHAISLAFLTQCIANLILTLDAPVHFLWVSAGLFGLSVWAIPSIMAVFTAETFGMEKTAEIFSKITLIFALGQIIGPIGAGFLTDLSGSFSYAFALSFLMTFFGFAASLSLIIKQNKV